GYGSAARRANVRGGDTVVVIGVGGIGTAAIQGARINGAARIVAVDPVAFKRESALTFGATQHAATASEAIDQVRELTRGVMADAVVVSPSMIGAADVAAALTLTRKGGTCVLTGLPSPATHSIDVALQDFILMNKKLCGTVFGSCNPRSDIPLLATMYRSGQLLLDQMITRRYRLDEINAAYADLAAGELIRGVIDFGIG
ncbi:zinc-binding dehydrogenase, partial [Mycobacterium montefiorense]